MKLSLNNIRRVFSHGEVPPPKEQWQFWYYDCRFSLDTTVHMKLTQIN